MNHDQESESFNYTYCASEQAEVQSIRKKYLPKEMDKMEQLRQLDRATTKKGTIISILLGILGALLLGIGMSCTMVWSEEWFIPGIIIGIAGIGLMAAALPLYNHITEKQRQKIAPEIIRLTDELMK